MAFIYSQHTLHKRGNDYAYKQSNVLIFSFTVIKINKTGQSGATNSAMEVSFKLRKSNGDRNGKTFNTQPGTSLWGCGIFCSFRLPNIS